MNLFKFTIVFALYLSLASLMLLGLVWGLSDSTNIFLEILAVTKISTLRMFAYGVFGITVICIIAYLNYSKSRPILPHSASFLMTIRLLINLLFVSFREEDDETFVTDLKYINEIIATLFFGIIGIFLVGYLFIEDVIEWQKIMLVASSLILPILIGAALTFLMTGPIVIITFYIGDLIKHYRS